MFLLVSNLTHGHSSQFSLTALYSPVDYALGFVSGIYEYKACWVCDFTQSSIHTYLLSVSTEMGECILAI